MCSTRCKTRFFQHCSIFFEINPKNHVQNHTSWQYCRNKSHVPAQRKLHSNQPSKESVSVSRSNSWGNDTRPRGGQQSTRTRENPTNLIAHRHATAARLRDRRINFSRVSSFLHYKLLPTWQTTAILILALPPPSLHSRCWSWERKGESKAGEKEIRNKKR